MKEEMDSPMKNQVWVPVDPPPKEVTIHRNRWVLKIKKDVTGKILKYKARLVAKGCSQKEGIDFTKTFSPVVRLSSIRLLLHIANLN